MVRGGRSIDRKGVFKLIDQVSEGRNAEALKLMHTEPNRASVCSEL